MPAIPSAATPCAVIPHTVTPHTIAADAATASRATPSGVAPSRLAASRTTPSRAVPSPVAPSTVDGRGRWLGPVLALVAVLAVLLGTGAPAAAAATGPTLITISGTGLSDPIKVRSDAVPDLFSALLKQLSWMQGATGTPMKVDQSTFGPKFTVTMSTDGSVGQVYDLYPEATGGPRAFRPAAQPQGKTVDAWFYAPVSLPDVLRAAGVPIVTTIEAGLDSGGYAPAVASASTSFQFGGLLTQLRTVILSSVATSIGSLLLLFGAARFSRSRYRRRTPV